MRRGLCVLIISAASILLGGVAVGVSTNVAPSKLLKKSKGASVEEAGKLAGQGDYTQALRMCDELISRGSFQKRAAIAKKAEILNKTGNYAQACACWENLTTSQVMGSDGDGILLKLAETYAFKLNAPEKAHPYYQKILKRVPPSFVWPDAAYQYAGMHMMAKDYTNAVALFRKLLDEYPTSSYAPQAKMYLQQAETSLERQQDEKLELEARLAMKKDETTADARKIKPLLKPFGALTESRATIEFRQAEALFARGMYKEALKSYAFVRVDPYCHEHPIALYKMGCCHALLAQDTQAIKLWEEAFDASRKGTNQVWAVLSLKSLGDTCFDKLADAPGALKYYRRLMASYPDDPCIPDVQKQIGIVYLYSGNKTDAQALFKQILAAHPPDPNEPPTDMERLLALSEGQAVTGIPDMKQVARDNRAGVFLRKGDIYFTAKKYNEAARAYKLAVSLTTVDDVAAYALMQEGRCYRQLDDLKTAIACYDRFLLKYARSDLAADVLMRLAAIYCGPMNDQNSAKDCYRRILKDYSRGDRVEQAQLSLASQAYWHKEWREALKLHEEFCAKFPNSPYLVLVTKERIPVIKLALGKKPAVIPKRNA